MRIDLSGQRFGRLLVVASAGFVNRRQRWLCRCDCGTTTTTRTDTLRAGTTSSCGCLNSALVRASLTKHSQAKRGAKSHLYRAWVAMKTRCLNPRYSQYKYWGGRGISIAPEWINDFSRFAQDVGEPPFPKATLDRVDNDGDYRPGNVRWATRAEQNRNQRPRRPHRTARL